MTTWEALPRMQAYLDSTRRALLSDIDGTLSPIAGRPEEATVDAGCRELLRQLGARVQLLAFVTGRPARQAREMVGLEAVYIGNHGLERWQAGQVIPLPELEPWRRALDQARRRLASELPEGALLEDKAWLLGVHYRQRPELEETVLALGRRVAEALGLNLARGRMVLELGPPVEADKGLAIRHLLEEHPLQAALYMGDDRTDVDGFRALREWPGTGLAVGVLSPESPPEVAQASHFTVEGVEGVRELLTWLVAKL